MKCLRSGSAIITGACQQKYPRVGWGAEGWVVGGGWLDEKCICSLERTKPMRGFNVILIDV